MAVYSYETLMAHYGHKLEVANYGDENATIECTTCNEVLVDFDREPGAASNIMGGDTGVDADDPYLFITEDEEEEEM